MDTNAINALRIDAYAKVYKALQLMEVGFLKRETLLSSLRMELHIDDKMTLEALSIVDRDSEMSELQNALREKPDTPMAFPAASGRPATANTTPPAAASPPPPPPPSTGRGRGRPPANRDVSTASVATAVHGTMPAPAHKPARVAEMKAPPAASPIAVEPPIPPAPVYAPAPKPKAAPPKKKHKGPKGLVAAAAAAAAAVSTPPPAPVPVAPAPIHAPVPATANYTTDSAMAAPAMITSDPQLSIAYDERSFQNWIKRATEADMTAMLACLGAREKEIQSEIARCDQILSAPPSPPPAPLPPPPPVVTAAPEPTANGGTWTAKPAAKLIKNTTPAAAPAAPPPIAAASTPARSPFHIGAVDNIPDDKLHTMSEAELYSLLHKVHLREESIMDELLQLQLSHAEIDMLAARLEANLSSISVWEKDLQTELSLLDKQIRAAA